MAKFHWPSSSQKRAWKYANRPQRGRDLVESITAILRREKMKDIRRTNAIMCQRFKAELEKKGKLHG